MENEKDQETIQKLLPLWRKLCLGTHELFQKVAAVGLAPINWVKDQIDGTADWKTMEAKLDEADRKKRLGTV